MVEDSLASLDIPCSCLRRILDRGDLTMKPDAQDGKPDENPTLEIMHTNGGYFIGI